MTARTIALFILFVVLTWSGAAGISFAITQTTEGPQGEQGPPGPQGPRGAQGPQGRAGETSSSSSGSPCEGAFSAYLEALQTPGISTTQLDGLLSFAKAACQQ